MNDHAHDETTQTERRTPRTPIEQAATLPGDLAVWDGNVAMIVGNGMMIEARNQWGYR